MVKYDWKKRIDQLYYKLGRKGYLTDEERAELKLLRAKELRVEKQKNLS